MSCVHWVSSYGVRCHVPWHCCNTIDSPLLFSRNSVFFFLLACRVSCAMLRLSLFCVRVLCLELSELQEGEKGPSRPGGKKWGGF